MPIVRGMHAAYANTKGEDREGGDRLCGERGKRAESFSPWGPTGSYASEESLKMREAGHFQLPLTQINRPQRMPVDSKGMRLPASSRAANLKEKSYI